MRLFTVALVIAALATVGLLILITIAGFNALTEPSAFPTAPVISP